MIHNMTQGPPDTPGTIDDLVADAHAAGYPARQRLVTDWTELGLLDSPKRQSLGRAHGQAKALYSSAQRALFATMLKDRETLQGLGTKRGSIRVLAQLPVFIWMYGRDPEWIPNRQLLRCLETIVDNGQASGLSAARKNAKVMMSGFLSDSTPRSVRRDIISAVGDYIFDWPDLKCEKHTPDIQAALEAASRAGVEPSVPDARFSQLLIPHVSVSMILGVIQSRLTAATAIAGRRVTDDDLTTVRERCRESSMEYFRADAHADLWNGGPFSRHMRASCTSDLLVTLGRLVGAPADTGALSQ